MKRIKRILLVLLAVAAVVLIYQYPIQKHLALHKFEEYISAQGVEVGKIAQKETFKDWKRGGYLVVVSFSDDVGNKYYYHYEPWTHKKGEQLKFDRMSLSIIDEKNSVELEAPYDGKCKYPPLEFQQDKSQWDCSVLCAGTSSDEEFIITYSHEKPRSTTGIFSFQNRNDFDIEIHLAREMYDVTPAPPEEVFVIPAGGVTARYQIEKNVSYQIGIHADVPVDTEIQLMVYDGNKTEVYSSVNSVGGVESPNHQIIWEEGSSIDAAIHNEILERNKNRYYKGTFACESHTIWGTEPCAVNSEQFKIETVYALALYEEFTMTAEGVQCVSGGCSPVVLTFKVTEDGYELSEYWEPRDGSSYADDIRSKFPEALWQAAFDNSCVEQQEANCLKAAQEFFEGHAQ